MMKNEECGMDEFLKMADKCSDKDKDKDKDLSTDKTGPRTRSSQTDRIQTARMPSTRDRVLQALRDIHRDKHGSTTKDKTVSGERTLEPTENSKTSDDCVAQGTRRTVGQSFTDNQESRTTEAILPLTTRMDMKCQTLLPTTKGNFLIAGATPDQDKNDDGTRTASTAWTVDAGNMDQGSHRMAVDNRFQPILLCVGSVDLRGSFRGFGFVDCCIVWRSSLVRRVIGRMYSLNWGDIVLDSKRNGTDSLCFIWGES